MFLYVVFLVKIAAEQAPDELHELLARPPDFLDGGGGRARHGAAAATSWRLLVGASSPRRFRHAGQGVRRGSLIEILIEINLL